MEAGEASFEWLTYYYSLVVKHCRTDPALSGEKGDGVSALNEVSRCLSTSHLRSKLKGRGSGGGVLGPLP